jgi:hypothetical protein
MIQHQQQKHHNMKVGASSTLGWKYLAQSWNLNNINTKLEIFSTRLASQQHQHKVGNLQHEAGITTTSSLRWKSST